MIDFTNCIKIASTYGGSEKKKKIIYNGETYLVKFPDPIREKGNSMSYMNNQFSEYIGCHIIETLGLNVQETLIGKYIEENKEKIVVACKDFTNENETLVEFTSLGNSITSTDKVYSTCIEDIYAIINNSDIKNKSEIITSFWDLFVADALIGNPDRHLDNIGLLYNKVTDSYSFSPIYDCGSSLHALLSYEKKEELLKNDTEFKNACYNVFSVYKLNGKKLFYNEIFKNPPEDLKQAILRIIHRINIEKINNIIDDTEGLLPLEKEFIKKSIKVRKEEILDKAYQKISKTI